MLINTIISQRNPYRATQGNLCLIYNFSFVPFIFLDQKAECAICQDQFELEEKVKQLPCKHNFHTPCIDPWLKMVSKIAKSSQSFKI